jgi:formylglycine-generating enzyme required for sulfatase activity
VEQGLSMDKAQAEAIAEEQAAKLIERLSAPDFQARRVYELTANPLLLANLCLVHRDRGQLPKRRAQLYAECIDVLLERWRAAKDLPLELTAEEGRRVLQPAALFMHEKENRTRVSATELSPVMESALNSIQWKRGGTAEFLRTIRDESGLLTGWGDGKYGFMHLGFQEYLAAREIRIQYLNGERGVLKALVKRFGESWWQEVILLLLALEEPPLFEPLMCLVVKTKAFIQHRELVEACLDDAAQVSAKPFVELLEEPVGKDKDLWARQHRALQILERLGSDIVETKTPKLRSHPSAEIRNWLRSREKEAERGVIYSEPSGVGLVRIPRGAFKMGSPDEEEGRYGDESPQHRVEVSSFYLSRYPVTNEEYGRYLTAKPETRKPEYWGERSLNQPQQPVVGVSWEEAKGYCDWAGLRLPSEAEWEYACRGGTETRYWSGNGEEDLERVGWYAKKKEKRLHAVGEKEPNPFGLYDMHGNVWEWVEDDWHDDYNGAPVDGRAWTDEPRAEYRVYRGGSWRYGAGRCRSASRGVGHPGYRDYYLGFRPARSFP